MAKVARRVRAAYSPDWDSGLEGWVTRQIAAHRWRIGPEYEFEDLIHEAYLLFYTLKNRYPRVSNQQHFMGLFKRSWINRVHKLAMECKVGQRREYEIVTPEGERADLGDLIPAKTQAALREVFMLMDDAPEAIVVILTDLGINEGLEQTRTPEYQRSGGRRETRLEWLCRRLGVSDTRQAERLIRNWIGGQPCC